jgi:4-amino-4-deoxychorismate lyase
MLLETILCTDGIAQNLRYHQYRLDRSLRQLGFSRSFDLNSLIIPPKEGMYRCRFVYQGFDYAIEYIPYCPKPISSLQLVNDDSIEYPLKYSDRTHLNALFEQRKKSDDVLIIKNGLLTDTTIANVALLINGQWVTPKSPLLEGTTRARLIEMKFLTVAPLTQYDIHKAKKVAVLNAMIGFVEVENGIII